MACHGWPGQGTPLEELDRKHFVKGYQAPNQKKSSKEIAQQVATSKNLALAEVKLQRLCELLQEVCMVCDVIQQATSITTILVHFRQILQCDELWCAVWMCTFWQAIEETKGHVEKKQALTYEEMEAEREEVSFPYIIFLWPLWLHPIPFQLVVYQGQQQMWFPTYLKDMFA